MSLVVALPASAQTTNCHTFGSNTTCQTTGGVDWGLAQQQQQQQQLNNSFAALGAAIRERRERKRQQQAFAIQQQADQQAQYEREAATQANANLRKMIIDGASQGACKESIQIAMSNGMIDLANQVTTYCSSHFPGK